MAPQGDYASFMRMICEQDKRWQSMFPPATPEQVAATQQEAITRLGVPLRSEYLEVVQWVNGGGRSVGLCSTHSFSYDTLFGPRPKEMTVGIVEENLQLRKQQIAGRNEIVYATGNGMVFLPGPTPGSWIGRGYYSPEAQWLGKSFVDLLRYVYQGDGTGGLLPEE